LGISGVEKDCCGNLSRIFFDISYIYLIKNENENNRKEKKEEKKKNHTCKS